MITSIQTTPAVMPAAALPSPGHSPTRLRPKRHLDPCRFLRHVPQVLQFDPLACLHAWTQRELSASAAVDRLTQRLAHDLAQPLVEESRRPALTLLLAALDTRRRAAHLSREADL